VLTLAGLGITQDQIASLLRLAPKTLRLHYRHELSDGVIKANAAVAQSLYHMAVKDKVPSAAIWWTKARMGWKDGTDLNVGGNGQPVKYEFVWGAATPEPLPGPDPAPLTIEAKAEEEADDRDAGGIVVRFRKD
jgi:hypothetical protein